MRNRIFLIGTLVILLSLITQIERTQAKARLFINSFDRQIDLTDGKTRKLNIRNAGKNIAKKAKYKISNKKVCSIKNGKVTEKKKELPKSPLPTKVARKNLRLLL